MDLADLTRDLEALQAEALAAIAAAPDVAALEALELDVLGKKGRLTGVLRGIGALPAEDRPQVGAIANRVRTAIERALEERGTGLRGSELDGPTWRPRPSTSPRPGRPIRRGSRHPINETIARDRRDLRAVRLRRVRGARDRGRRHATSRCSTSRRITRRATCGTRSTSTSRASSCGRTRRPARSASCTRTPPIRALLPGRCFRYEAIDASHASEFFQVEGLMVDEGTTMGDLKGLLEQFAKAMYGADKRTRFRPGYYPFTEPSVAFDVECLVCGGSGCPACSRSGWMTILGAGMVHPVVLQYGGLDPERYQGFAFGMGVERIANLRHSVGDLRLYMENDLRFLEQFQ